MATIAFSSDHAGYKMKLDLIAYVESLGYDTLDLGAQSEESYDYPDSVPPLLEAMVSTEADFGVLLCGSGIGVDIAANRHKELRAALCQNGLMAKMARLHNDANVLCLGARFIGMEIAIDCVDNFLNTSFEGGRHARRVEKLG